MRIKTGLAFILSILILLGSSAASAGASANKVPENNNAPVSVITSDSINTAYQQTIFAEIVRENTSEVKVINGPVLVLDEEGCIYGPADKTPSVDITKDIKVTADNTTLEDLVLNGNLYIYSDNVVLSRLVIKGTIYISPGKALKLDQITSENIEVIMPDELEALQPQDKQAFPEALPTEDEQVSTDVDTATAAEASTAQEPAVTYQHAEIDTPIILDIPSAQSQGVPAAAQPQGLSQVPEITIEAQSPEKPKAIRAYLKAASINDASSLIVVVNKDRGLPSSWKPDDLVKLQVPYKGRAEARYLRKEAADALTKLFAKAKSDGIELYAVSGYRSYNLQNTVFTNYTNKLGVLLAQRVSAKPGQSEHQTGLAIDISSRSMNYNLNKSFGKLREGKWLEANAAEFGFVLRYPNGSEAVTGYDYEPWHFRYVGVGIATDVMNKGLTLEEYFGLFEDEMS